MCQGVGKVPMLATPFQFTLPDAITLKTAIGPMCNASIAANVVVQAS